MSIKNIQFLYKRVSEELSNNNLNESLSLTPSKRATKDGLAKNVETLITTLKTHA